MDGEIGTGSYNMGPDSTKLEGCLSKYKNHSVCFEQESGHQDASSLKRRDGSNPRTHFPMHFLSLGLSFFTCK